ncbi:MAG: lipoprotein-releasing ABC transporter permease subunit [Pseudomonadota bacterium]
MLSLRYLRARRRESFISVISLFSFLGILLGVATLIIVMAVMNGFRSELLGKILGFNGHVIVQAVDGPFTDFPEVSDRIAALSGIRVSLPVVEGQVMASTPLGAFGALIRGVRDQDLAKLDLVTENLLLGSLETFGDGQGIAIGSRLAERLGVRLEDTVTLIAPRGEVTPFGTTPRIKPYRVIAIFEVGMSDFDATQVFLALPEAQAFFNMSGTVHGIEVFVDDPDQVDLYLQPITSAADRGVFVSDWRQRNRTFFNALQVERNVMFLILTLIILVAALNIVSGMIMLVKDKGRDIAILRTMGASRGAIMRVFFMTGATIGVLGTAAGCVVGIIVCLNIETIRQFISRLTGTELFSPELYYLSQLPAEMDPAEVISVVVMSLVLCFLATLYPSWRAARLDPVEALRYE